MQAASGKHRQREKTIQRSKPLNFPPFVNAMRKSKQKKRRREEEEKKS
jgi:hypothetical protein